MPKWHLSDGEPMKKIRSKKEVINFLEKYIGENGGKTTDHIHDLVNGYLPGKDRIVHKSGFTKMQIIGNLSKDSRFCFNDGLWEVSDGACV